MYLAFESQTNYLAIENVSKISTGLHLAVPQ